MESCKSDIIINNSNLSTQKSNNYKPERTFELESKFLKMKNQRIKRSFTIGSGIGHRWVPNELQNQSSFFLSAFLALWERANGVIIIIIVIIGVGFGLWDGDTWMARIWFWEKVKGGKIWFDLRSQNRFLMYARKLWFRWELPPAWRFRYFRGRPIPIIPPEMYKV